MIQANDRQSSARKHRAAKARSQRATGTAAASAGKLVFAKYTPALLALPKHALLVVNVDIPAAVGVALEASARLSALRPELRATFLKLDFAQIDALEDYAHVLAFAHRQLLQASSVPPEAEQQRLRAMKLRRLLRDELKRLVSLEVCSSDTGVSLSGRVGHKQVATDLSVLVALFQTKGLPTFKHALPQRILVEARELSGTLLGLLGRRAGMQRGLLRQTELRQRAFTLFYRAYTEAKHAVSFLRRYQGDAEQITPPLQRRAPRQSPPQVSEAVT